jgi:hypothetical protein
VEPLDVISKFDEPNTVISRPLSAARKNFSVVYETADTRISSNYNTLGGVSNKQVKDRKNTNSGLDFQNFKRNPLDVLQPNEVLFGPPRNGKNLH